MTDSNLLDNGSEIYSDVMKCPFCDHDDQNFKIGRNECEECGGKFKIETDDEQQIFILIKDLKWGEEWNL